MNDLLKKSVQEVAYFTSEKRRTINELCPTLHLGGDSKSDWYGAEIVTNRHIERFLSQNTDANSSYRDSDLISYNSQVFTAIDLYKQYENNNNLVTLLGPMQSGKTGTFLILCEILLKHWHNTSKLGTIIILSMPGQTNLEDQITKRINKYKYISSVEHYEDLVRVTRCNKSKKDINLLQKQILSSSKENPLLMIVDEMQIGGEIDSILSRDIYKIIEDKFHSDKEAYYLLTASATPYEHIGAESNRFQTVLMRLSKGYTGPNKIYGKEFPTDKDYLEKNVKIEESIPEILKYYSGSSNKIDKNKLTSMCKFVLDIVKKYDRKVIRWKTIDAANIATDFFKKAGIENIINHYGTKELKTTLEDKIPNKKYCIFVVDSMKCSKTLPRDIEIGIDTATFGLSEEKSTLSPIMQGLYGRFCGYWNEKEPKLITVLGMNRYIEEYKEEITGGKIDPHLRVKKERKKSGFDRHILLPEKYRYLEGNLLKQNVIVHFMSDKNLEKIQNLYREIKFYENGKIRTNRKQNKDKEILKEVTTLVNNYAITPLEKRTFITFTFRESIPGQMRHMGDGTIEGKDYVSQTFHPGKNPTKRIALAHDGKEVWGIGFQIEKQSINNGLTTKDESIYSDFPNCELVG